MDQLMATTTAERTFTPLAVGLLLMTALIDPVYSASLGAVLIVAYVAVAYRTRAR
jgi:hypothetical protein